MRFAVIGLGNMGRAFAARALERGHAVTVWNRSPGRADDLVASGAVEAASAGAAAADAECVLVVLADDDAVLDVCLGHDGVLAALGPAAVLAQVSTVSPATARRLAAAGPPDRVLDSPVAGSPAAIAAGEGRFLVGGPADAIAAVRPLWDDLGAGLVHCGPSGAGATMKLVLNLLLITGVAALAEAVATARAHGITDELLRAALPGSAVLSAASTARFDSLMSPDHPGWFTPALARKDVMLATALAREAGLDVRIGPGAEALLGAVIDSGSDWPDFSAVIEALG
jgi:3-hydroxyisobutyrate dehydrogenase-like beta-hydroxyacid dehydrogenase